jgi:hypothetical protein
VVWRGPMVNRMIDQFLSGTEWGRLDVLVVDLPPGGPQRAAPAGPACAGCPAADDGLAKSHALPPSPPPLCWRELQRGGDEIWRRAASPASWSRSLSRPT